MKRLLLNTLIVFILAACVQTADIQPDGSGLYHKYYGNGIALNLIGTTGIPEGRSLCLTTNGELIGIGTLFSGLENILAQTYIFKVDINGMLIKSLMVGEDLVTRAVDIATDASGEHIVLLNTTTPSGIKLIRINDDLETIWTSTQLGSGYEGRALNVDNSGNIVILGNYYPVPGGPGKMFTATVSPDGSDYTVNFFGTEGEDNPVGKSLSVYEESNQRYAWCSDDITKDPSKPKIIITDDEGTVWTGDGIEADEDKEESGSEILRTFNGDFMIVGNITIASSDTDMRLVRLNKDGQVIWAKNFGGAGSQSGVSVCEADDGGFLVLGSAGTSTNDKTDIYLVKTDFMGEVLWEKTYGGPENDLASKIIRVDKGYAIIGTADFAGTKMITLIRTDLEGRIIKE